MRSINEIINSKTEEFNSFGDSIKNMLRVACPGIIQNFDSEAQTVTVQLALREHVIKQDMTKEWGNIPLLLDVPIILPRAGDYCITMPVKQGDECLIVFADMCIDGWFSYGGIQNQIEKRRHDLSDGFAILGVWSQPNRVKKYSTDSCQIRTLEGSTYIELKKDEINLVSKEVKINGVTIKG